MATALESTLRDQLALQQAWVMGDAVTGLRVWGTSYERLLPPGWDGHALVVGRTDDAFLQLSDKKVSRVHATIKKRGPEVWMVAHRAPKETQERYLWADGSPHAAVQLVPGTVVGIGDVPLVVFSARTQEIRAGLARYVGYDALAQEQLDKALYAALRRHHIEIVTPPGGGALTLARYLHDAAGPLVSWPFVTPREIPTDPEELVASAQCGTLVVRAESLRERNAGPLAEALAQDRHRVRLVLLAKPGESVPEALRKRLRIATITVPALSERRADRRQLVTDTVNYYAVRGGATKPLLTVDDYKALDRLPADTSHDDLEKLVEVLVHVRQFRLRGAAKRLGRDRGGLSKYLERYGLDARTDDDEGDDA